MVISESNKNSNHLFSVLDTNRISFFFLLDYVFLDPYLNNGIVLDAYGFTNLHEHTLIDLSYSRFHVFAF